jgi:hypothetical protein
VTTAAVSADAANAEATPTVVDGEQSKEKVGVRLAPVLSVAADPFKGSEWDDATYWPLHEPTRRSQQVCSVRRKHPFVCSAFLAHQQTDNAVRF